MNAKELAAKLDGIEYDSDFFEKITQIKSEAKAAGLVVVYGESDDLMEFVGAIEDEVGAPGDVRVDSRGLIPEWESIDHDDIDVCRNYFERERGSFTTIRALWCKEEGYSWTIHTAIPHEIFNVMEDGEKFCRGIVFNIGEISPF